MIIKTEKVQAKGDVTLEARVDDSPDSRGRWWWDVLPVNSPDYRSGHAPTKKEATTAALEALQERKEKLTAVAEVYTDPNVMGGAACIGQTRIPVYMVLDQLAAADVVTEYPSLTRDQVRQALSYAARIVENCARAEGKVS